MSRLEALVAAKKQPRKTVTINLSVSDHNDLCEIASDLGCRPNEYAAAVIGDALDKERGKEQG